MITNKKNSGQVALVLVLVMTVVSALAVSLAGRSVVNTKVQEIETESSKAQLAAQSGLEQILMNPETNTAVDPQKGYSATKVQTGTGGIDAGRIEVGAAVDIDTRNSILAKLTGIKVSWSPDVTGGEPAVLISEFRSNGQIRDYAYDYHGQNGFTVAAAGSDGYAKTTPVLINIYSTTTKIRVQVLGSAARLKIEPLGTTDAQLPAQLSSIQSVGSATSADRIVKYGLEYQESLNDTVPGVFDYALFSGGSIVQ